MAHDIVADALKTALISNITRASNPACVVESSDWRDSATMINSLSEPSSWIVIDIQPVTLIGASTIESAYAARGHRVVGRKIRQMRRRWRDYASHYPGVGIRRLKKRLRRERATKRAAQRTSPP